MLTHADSIIPTILLIIAATQFQIILAIILHNFTATSLRHHIFLIFLLYLSPMKAKTLLILFFHLFFSF